MDFLQAVKITNARRTIGPIGMVYIYNILMYIHIYSYIHTVIISIDTLVKYYVDIEL